MLSSLLLPCRFQSVARSALVSTTRSRHAVSRRRTFASTKGPIENDPLALRRQAQEARQKRADQLHEEIAGITQKQDKRHVQENNKLKGSQGFSEFLRNNKTSLSVVVVSFLTVVLSAKLVQGNQKCRKLEQDLESTQEQIKEKRQLLKTLTSEEVVSQMAAQCAQALDNNPPKGKGWFGSRSSNDTTTMISTILAQNLATMIGDAALNNNEKNAKQLKELNAPSTGDAAIEVLQQSGPNNHHRTMTAASVTGDKGGQKSVFVI